MIKVSIETDLSGIEKKISERKEMTVRALEGAVISSCDPYVPYNTGRLCSSAHPSGSGDIGEVTYSADYAAVCYYANREFSKKKHPLATAQWFEAAKISDIEKWIYVAKGCLGGASDTSGAHLKPYEFSAAVY